MTTTSIQSPSPIQQDLRCTSARETVGSASMQVVRCTPAAPFTGFPWADPLPQYVRVPIVLAPGGSVRAEITGDHESATVSPLQAAQP